MHARINDACGPRVKARFLNAHSANFVSNKWNHIWYLRVVHGPQANVNGFKLQSAIHSLAPRRLGEKVLGENWIIESLVNGRGCVNEFCMRSFWKYNVIVWSNIMVDIFSTHNLVNKQQLHLDSSRREKVCIHTHNFAMANFRYFNCSKCLIFIN